MKGKQGRRYVDDPEEEATLLGESYEGEELFDEEEQRPRVEPPPSVCCSCQSRNAADGFNSGLHRF